MRGLCVPYRRGTLPRPHRLFEQANIRNYQGATLGGAEAIEGPHRRLPPLKHLYEVAGIGVFSPLVNFLTLSKRDWGYQS